MSSRFPPPPWLFALPCSAARRWRRPAKCRGRRQPPGGTLPLDELRTFAEVLDRIKTAYVEPMDDKTLLENAIKGMLSNLDPHSAYLEPEAFQELQESTSGEFGGLGIEVGPEDGFIKVISPIDDTPAAQSRHRAGRSDQSHRRPADQGPGPCWRRWTRCAASPAARSP